MRMAGLCYDTQPVEAMPFPVAMLNKTPWALSEDFYQEKLPSKSLAERLRRKMGLREACIQEKSPLKPLFGFVASRVSQGDKRHHNRQATAYRVRACVVVTAIRASHQG